MGYIYIYTCINIYIYLNYIEFSVDVLDRIIWWILNSVTLYQ